jgi:hypothetical protein
MKNKPKYPLPIVLFESYENLPRFPGEEQRRGNILLKGEVLTVNINAGSMRVRILDGEIAAGTRDVSASFFFDQFYIKDKNVI